MLYIPLSQRNTLGTINLAFSRAGLRYDAVEAPDKGKDVIRLLNGSTPHISAAFMACTAENLETVFQSIGFAAAPFHALPAGPTVIRHREACAQPNDPLRRVWSIYIANVGTHLETSRQTTRLYEAINTHIISKLPKLDLKGS